MAKMGVRWLLASYDIIPGEDQEIVYRTSKNARKIRKIRKKFQGVPRDFGAQISAERLFGTRSGAVNIMGIYYQKWKLCAIV